MELKSVIKNNEWKGCVWHEEVEINLLTVLKCFFRRPKLKISIEWRYDEEKKNLLIDSPRVTIESKPDSAIEKELEKMPHMRKAL